MKGNPFRILHKDQTRRDHQLREIIRLYSHLLVSLEVDAGFLQQLDRVRGVHVVAGPESDYRGAANAGGGSLYAEVKVELPCRHVLGIVSVFVGQCDADLYYLEQVDVTSHSLVVVVRGRLKRSNRTRDDARKLGILRGYKSLGFEGRRRMDRDHCNIGILVDEISYVSHFCFQLRGPNFPYSRHGGSQGYAKLSPSGLLQH